MNTPLGTTKTNQIQDHRHFWAKLVCSICFLSLVMFFSASDKPVSATLPVSARVEESKVNVVVYLKAQPVQEISPQVQEKYRPHLESMQAEISSLYLKRENIGSSPGGESEKSLAQIELQISDLSQLLEDELQSMRRQIIQEAMPLALDSQAPVVAWLKSIGADIHSQLVVINALGAAVPESRLQDLKNRPEVAGIELSRVLNPQLDHSFNAIGAKIWHDNNFLGQNWEPAIIDSGVDVTHPALSSHSWISRRCLNAAGDPPQDHTTDDTFGHGTMVAGPILSSDSSFMGLGVGVGTAYNLKAVYTTDGLVAQMVDQDAMDCVNWAITMPDDPPDVLSFNFSTCSDSMPDYDFFAAFWDSVVENFRVPVVLPAGNYKGTSDPCTRYIGTPALAYNAITVGNVKDFNDATVDDPMRANDVINADSSLGPTPGGRKKPDISAPGTDIFTTSSTWESDPGTGDDFVSATGTSIASAHVAGALLLLEEFGVIDPTRQKALLINSAQDKGSPGWDPEYGWGYLDMGKANSERTFIHSDTVRVAPDHVLYQGQCTDGWKSTLVWNLRSDYRGPNLPPFTYALSDLDLFLYREQTNELLDMDSGTQDNVHQVDCPGVFDDVVLKVDSVSTEFDQSIGQEYSLAFSQVFGVRAAPLLNILPPAETIQCLDSDFQFTLPVENIGGLLAHQVSISLTIPPGLSLSGGANPQVTSGIWDGSSVSFDWQLHADSVGLHDISASASSSSYGETYTESDVIPVQVLDHPLAPTLISPMDGLELNDFMPVFSWNPESMALRYRIQVDTDPEFFSPDIDERVRTNSYTALAELDPGTYFWRVQSWNPCSSSSWTSVWSFIIEESKVYIPIVIR